MGFVFRLERRFEEVARSEDEVRRDLDSRSRIPFVNVSSFRSSLASPVPLPDLCPPSLPILCLVHFLSLCSLRVEGGPASKSLLSRQSSE
jgi:hypothetical protein